MDLGDACPQLLARCHRVPCTLGEFADKAQAFVAELMPLHPGFRELRFTGRRKADSPPLEADLSNLRQGIFERGWDRQAPEDRRYGWGPDGEPTASSRIETSFQLDLTNLSSWDDKIDVSSNLGGGSHIPANCVATFPRKAYPEFREQPLAGRIFEVFVKHWPTRYGSYATNGWNDAFNFEPRRAQKVTSEEMEIGWLNYSEDASIAEALPLDRAIRCQPLGKGVLIQLGDHLLDIDNPADVALASAVKQALAAAGKLKPR